MTKQLSPHAHTLFSIAAVQFYIPINRIQKFQFLHRLTNICYLLIVFNNSHLNGCHQLSFSFSDYIFHFQSSIPFFFFQTSPSFYFIMLSMVICYPDCDIFLSEVFATFVSIVSFTIYFTHGDFFWCLLILFIIMSCLFPLDSYL